MPRITGRPERDPDELIERFRASFDADDDLGQLSDAARRVLSVAAALYCRSGSLAVSVRDLTRACGLTPGALYNHFASRDELLFVLVDNGHVRTERRLGQALADASASPPQRLSAYVTAYIEVHIRFPEHAQLVHREYVHLEGERRARIVESRRRMREWLVEILRAGARSGEFDLVDGEAGAVAAAMMILDMCGRTSDWFDPSQQSPTIVERYVTGALRLVGSRPG